MPAVILYLLVFQTYVLLKLDLHKPIRAKFQPRSDRASPERRELNPPFSQQSPHRITANRSKIKQPLSSCEPGERLVLVWSISSCIYYKQMNFQQITLSSLAFCLICSLNSCKKVPKEEHVTNTQQARVSTLELTKDTIAQPVEIGESAFSIEHTPDYVACDVPRTFFIQIECPEDLPEITIKHDDSVELLDRRKLKTRLEVFDYWANPDELKQKAVRSVRRFYFRTLQSTDLTTIKLRSNDQSGWDIPLTLLSYEDMLRPTLINGLELPRTYPIHKKYPYLKGRQVHDYSEEASKNKNKITNTISYIDSDNINNLSLENVWSVTPDTSLSDNWQGGSAIDLFSEEKNWLNFLPLNPDKGYWPLLIQNGTPMPSNNIYADDFSSGEFVDDGEGHDLSIERPGMHASESWRGEALYSPSHYGHHIFYRLNAADRLMEAYARNYTHTGDIRYARLALVGLIRTSMEFGMQSYLTNNSGKIRNSTKLKFANIKHKNERKGVLTIMIGEVRRHMFIWSNVYDRIYPAIAELDKDKDLVAFLQSKNMQATSSRDFQTIIEQSLFRPAIQSFYDGVSHCNFPIEHLSLSNILNVLDYPDPHLLDAGFYEPGKKHGNDLKNFATPFVDTALNIAHYRSGVKFETPGSYNLRSLNSIHGAFKILDDYISRNRDTFSVTKYPLASSNKKFGVGLQSMINHALIPNERLRLGDSGWCWPRDSSKSKFPNYLGDEDIPIFEHIYTINKDPQLAWALSNTAGWEKKSQFNKEDKAALVEHSQSLPDDWRTGVKHLSGMGISLLRSGTKENERCLVNYYGRVHGHASDAAISLHLMGHGGPIINHWGYGNLDSIEGAFWHSWFTKNTGRVYPILDSAAPLGQPEYSTEMGSALLTDASASLVRDHRHTTKKRSRYETLNGKGDQRRMFMLVNTSEEDFYVLDFYRMLGGKEHWRMFQCVDGKLDTHNLKLKKRRGTLAGEDVPHRDHDWVKSQSKNPKRPQWNDYMGFATLYDVKHDPSPANDWAVSIAPSRDPGYKINRYLIESSKGEVYLAKANSYNRFGKDLEEMKQRKSSSKAKDPVYERDFVVTKHTAKIADSLASYELALIAPGYGSTLIKSIKKLDIQSEADDQNFQPVACVVTTGKYHDYFIFSTKRSVKTIKSLQGKEISLNGRVAFLRTNHRGNLVESSIADGVSLKYGNETLIDSLGDIEGEIVDCNYDNYEVVIPHTDIDVNSLVHQSIYIERGNFNIPYLIQSVRVLDEGVALKLNAAPLIGMMPFDSIENGCIGEDSMKLSRHRYFHGASIIGNSGKRYTVDTIVKGIQVFDPINGQTPKDLLVKEFGDQSVIKIYDYAKGDKFILPGSGRFNNK